MLKRIALIGALVVIIAVGGVAWYLFRPPETASAPIEAIPLAQATAVATSAPVAEAATSAPTAAEAATTAPTAAEAATTAPVAEATTTAPVAEAAATSGATIFEIVPAESEARFLIDEVLRGDPVTVVGATDQVAGQIEIDPNNPSTARIGVIQINARTLATDNDFRNRAIKNAILETDVNEFITFTPTSIVGLASSASVGTATSFQIMGDLTIKDVTKPVTFDVSVTPATTSRIEGTASTTVNYRDFELAIPDSPSVDTVADQVRLELEFVAEPAA